jgi:preprotein translocase subunit SecY
MNLSIIVGLVLVALIVVLLLTNKKLVETLKNIYKIEELRKRILFTLGLLLIYRLGSFVTLPGVNHEALSNMTQSFNDGSLLGLLNVFSGGAFSQASIFALGVMPYITASIIIQLLGIMVPYFRKMQREGESGRRKMNQWTRFLTIAVLILQGPAYLYSQVLSWGAVAPACSGDLLGIANGQFVIPAVVILIAGTMFIMWLGEKITDKGIGNGISLIIMIGIVARLPQAFMQEFNLQVLGDGSIIMFIVELIFLALVFMLAIAIVQAVRRIPVQYAKRIVGNKQYGGVRQYIPLKLNAANVMPIIFAQALMFIPGLIWPNVQAWQFNGWAYNVALVVMVIAFTFFYTAIIVNPQMMADDMKRNGGFIPGVKPGKSTVKYIDDIMTRITLPGSIFLALITILPAIAMALGVDNNFAYFFGGTSLLIMVGVVLDTLKQVESYLLMRHYDGLMKTGRIQGRY